MVKDIEVLDKFSMEKNPFRFWIAFLKKSKKHRGWAITAGLEPGI